MSSTYTDQPFSGPLPYHLASTECQLNAQQHVQELLHKRFPTLTEADWDRLFTTCQPLLWVDEPTRTVAVTNEAMPDLVNQAAAYKASERRAPQIPLFMSEERYLARQLDYYCRMASRLMETDPELTHPDSITAMRNVFFRLSVGNAVAERLAEIPAQ